MADSSNETREDRLLTAPEAARYLGYAEGTVRNKASTGEIPSVKLGSGNGALRFRLSVLDRWIEQQDAEARATAAAEKVPVSDPAA